MVLSGDGISCESVLVTAVSSNGHPTLGTAFSGAPDTLYTFPFNPTLPHHFLLNPRGGAEADCDGVLTADDCDDADPALPNDDDMDCDGVLTAD